jgi:ectoine hydroxylase-related dioxygenase (phytanoyl-CoA dioxygenase family)
MVQRIEHPKSCGVTFARDGAQRFHSALGVGTLHDIDRAVAAFPSDQAGIRLYGNRVLQPFLVASGAVGAIAASVLGPACRPVRAIFFDKTRTTNWSLGWHQDRTIVVAKRVEVEGFGPWTVKSGLLHVAPPTDVLASMVTLRVHFDPVPATNAPLLIAPGSHKFGRIPETEVLEVVKQCGTFVCLADPGDIWLYSTLILHASEAASEPAHRRVLQVDFGASDLPGGLEWLGV